MGTLNVREHIIGPKYAFANLSFHGAIYIYLYKINILLYLYIYQVRSGGGLLGLEGIGIGSHASLVIG